MPNESLASKIAILTLQTVGRCRQNLQVEMESILQGPPKILCMLSQLHLDFVFNVKIYYIFIL